MTDIDVELCFGQSWGMCGNLYLGKFVALPRVGETIEIPDYTPGCYEVVGLRHRTATPKGDRPCVRLLVRPVTDASNDEHRDGEA